MKSNQKLLTKRDPRRLLYRKHPRKGWQVWAPYWKHWVPAKLHAFRIRHWLTCGFADYVAWVDTWAEAEGPRLG